MKRNLLLTIILVVAIQLFAIEKVKFPESFSNGWDAYVGKIVQITTPLYVCGNYYDSLILSPERLYVPEELATNLSRGDSTEYWEIKHANKKNSLRLSCQIANYKVRTGSIVKNLQARVVAPGKLVTGSTPKFIDNTPDTKPKMPKSGLLICAANIQNYFYDLGGYAQTKTTKEQQVMQTLKICKAFKQIDADIYALCEIQRGDSAPQMLVDAMNRMAKKEKYAYVSDGWDNQDMIACGYIYRKDRVRAYGEMQHGYADTASHYHYRLIAMGFEELSSGEKFVLNINHFRSKRGTEAESNEKRMGNVDSLLVMLEKIEKEQLFDDSDILLVGDYNAYTQEQPIRTIVEAGYDDMVIRYDFAGYSYVYHSEVGFLDRVFASKTMAKQVKKVSAYHLNADYFYSRGFKRGLDNTMYRYADHDPLLISVKLGE